MAYGQPTMEKRVSAVESTLRVARVAHLNRVPDQLERRFGREVVKRARQASTEDGTGDRDADGTSHWSAEPD